MTDHEAIIRAERTGNDEEPRYRCPVCREGLYYDDIIYVGYEHGKNKLLGCKYCVDIRTVEGVL